MWWLISVLYAAAGLLIFRVRFRTLVKVAEKDLDASHLQEINQHKKNGYCHRKCTGTSHVPSRPTLDWASYSLFSIWALGYALFWLPIFMGKAFWKALFPKGVLAETRKERNQRLKKEAEAEAEALLQKAKEMGLM